MIELRQSEGADLRRVETCQEGLVGALAFALREMRSPSEWFSTCFEYL